MEITQTIKLSGDERETLNAAIGIIDKISNTVNCSMSDVFTYLVSISTFYGAGNYEVDEILQIADLR